MSGRAIATRKAGPQTSIPLRIAKLIDAAVREFRGAGLADGRCPGRCGAADLENVEGCSVDLKEASFPRHAGGLGAAQEKAAHGRGLALCTECFGGASVMNGGIWAVGVLVFGITEAATDLGKRMAEACITFGVGSA